MFPQRLYRVCTRLFFAATAAIVINLAGCSMEDNKKGPSDDLAALRATVRIPAEVRSARWEVFGTPEYNGGVPGPTDYLTLVAELDGQLNAERDAGDKSAEGTLPDRGASVHIVPEAARPWLTSDFRTLLMNSKNTALALSPKNACQPYQSALVKTGKPVSGFVCRRTGRALLYLTLLADQPAE